MDGPGIEPWSEQESFSFPYPSRATLKPNQATVKVIPSFPRLAPRLTMSGTISVLSSLCQSWHVTEWPLPSPFFFRGATASSGPGPAHYGGFTITLRHTTFGRTPLDEWSARRRELYMTDSVQNSQETDIHAHCRIRTHNPSKQTAAEPRHIHHYRQ
jgi:hypothetical protein